MNPFAQLRAKLRRRAAHGAYLEPAEDLIEAPREAALCESVDKFQLDVAQLHVSLISRNGAKQRREFVLACLEEIEFLAVEAGSSRDLQLKVGGFQVDNNIEQEARQRFPIAIYPKDRDLSPTEAVRRKDFFNAHVALETSARGVVVANKIEFLLQSAVVKMDDELVHWLRRFVASCA